MLGHAAQAPCSVSFSSTTTLTRHPVLLFGLRITNLGQNGRKLPPRTLLGPLGQVLLGHQRGHLLGNGGPDQLFNRAPIPLPPTAVLPTPLLPNHTTHRP